MNADLAQKLDFANHHADATEADIQKLCDGVLQYGFNSAFVNPTYVSFAKKFLAGKAKVGTVISFPLGEDMLDVKLLAIKDALAAGVDELDIVPNLGLFITGKTDEFLSEMKQIVSTVREIRHDAIVKFILDPGYIEGKLAEAAKLVAASGADFVKIGSGMGPRGPSVKDIEVVKAAVGNSVRIKAAGGINTYEEAMALLSAGADRLGTSHAIEIVQGTPPAPK